MFFLVVDIWKVYDSVTVFSCSEFAVITGSYFLLDFEICVKIYFCCRSTDLQMGLEDCKGLVDIGRFGFLLIYDEAGK